MSKSITSFFKPKKAAGKVTGTDDSGDSGDKSSLGKRSIEGISSLPLDDAHVSETSVKVVSESKSDDKEEEEEANEAVVMPVPDTAWIPVSELRSWIPILEKEFAKPYFSRLDSFLERETSAKKIFPPRELVFSAFSACAFDDIKVVVIGQDPYHGPNQAHGLAFSVMKPERPPPSLKNIFKEAKNCIPGFAVPSHGDLSGWSRQGVFLLNTCLTVQQGNANSHQKKGWEEFVTAVIKAIDQREDKIVFLLWGKPANERCAHINRRKHTVISSSHPSPLGATKTATPFIGSKCFLKCNDALVAAGKTPIDWNL